MTSRHSPRNVAGRLRALATLSAASLLGACGRHAVSAIDPRQPFDSATAVASFDTVWRVIRDTHYDSALKGVDWNAARRELRPQVERARDLREVRGILANLVQRLGDSHYGIIPAEAVAQAAGPSEATVEPGGVGLDLRLIDGRMLVTRVDRESAAARAGIAPGWEVERVDTLNVKALVRSVARTGPTERRVAGIHAALAAMRRFDGAMGEPLTLRLRDGANEVREIHLTRGEVRGEWIRYGNLPPMLLRFESERTREAAGCVGIIRFSTWMPQVSAALERAVQAERGCGAMVIDLRGNLGGVASMAMGAAGWFVDQELPLGVMTTRTTSLRFTTLPQRSTRSGETVTPFAGPLAILVDRHSASTTEMFVAGLQALGRVRVFGDTTAGQALPATLLRLPDGDVLLYAVANFVSSNGIRLDGRGVIPDVTVPLTREALNAGRDPALDASLAWLRGAVARRPGP